MYIYPILVKILDLKSKIPQATRDVLKTIIITIAPRFFTSFGHMISMILFARQIGEIFRSCEYNFDIHNDIVYIYNQCVGGENYD